VVSFVDLLQIEDFQMQPHQLTEILLKLSMGVAQVVCKPDHR